MENTIESIRQQAPLPIEKLLLQTRNTSIWLKIISICILLVSFTYIYLGIKVFSGLNFGSIDTATYIVFLLIFGGPLAMAVVGIMAASNADKAYKSKSADDVFRFFKSLNTWFGVLAILSILITLLLILGFIALNGLNSGNDLFF